MTIQLVYIATGVYCNFAENYFASVNNLFPGSEKIIDILTDRIDYFEQFKNESFLKFNVHRIFQLPYPIVNYMKFSYIKGILDYEADATIFVDADCAFMQKPESFWNNLSNHFSANKILISYHMMYYKIIHGEIYLEGQNPYYDLMFLQTLHETDSTKASYVPYPEFMWIQTCVCAAPPKEFYKLCVKLENVIGKDLKDSHYIPQLNEETYMNKLLYEYYTGIDMSLQFVPNLYTIQSRMLKYLNYSPMIAFVTKEANEDIKKEVKDNIFTAD